MKLVRLTFVLMLIVISAGCASDRLFIEDHGLPWPEDSQTAPPYKNYGGVI